MEEIGEDGIVEWRDILLSVDVPFNAEFRVALEHDEELSGVMGLEFFKRSKEDLTENCIYTRFGFGEPKNMVCMVECQDHEAELVILYV